MGVVFGKTRKSRCKHREIARTKIQKTTTHTHAAAGESEPPSCGPALTVSIKYACAVSWWGTRMRGEESEVRGAKEDGVWNKEEGETGAEEAKMLGDSGVKSK